MPESPSERATPTAPSRCSTRSIVVSNAIDAPLALACSRAVAEMRSHDPHRGRRAGLVGLGERLVVQHGARGIPRADAAPPRAGGHDRIGEPDAVERPQRVLQQRDAGAEAVLTPGRLDHADLGARSRQAVREREPPDAAAGDDGPHPLLLMPSVERAPRPGARPQAASPGRGASRRAGRCRRRRARPSGADAEELHRPLAIEARCLEHAHRLLLAVVRRPGGGPGERAHVRRAAPVVAGDAEARSTAPIPGSRGTSSWARARTRQPRPRAMWLNGGPRRPAAARPSTTASMRCWMPPAGSSS